MVKFLVKHIKPLSVLKVKMLIKKGIFKLLIFRYFKMVSSSNGGIAQLQRLNFATPTTTTTSTNGHQNTPIVITNGSGGHHHHHHGSSTNGDSSSSPSTSVTAAQHDDLIAAVAASVTSDADLGGGVGDELENNIEQQEEHVVGEADGGEDEEEEEPLYVNAKQYNRILKRRLARAKLESEGRIPKIRQVIVFLRIYRSFKLTFKSIKRSNCRIITEKG